MFEPSWFIAGNVAVSKMNGFEDTVMLETYADAEVCDCACAGEVIIICKRKIRAKTVDNSRLSIYGFYNMGIKRIASDLLPALRG